MPIVTGNDFVQAKVEAKAIFEIAASTAALGIPARWLRCVGEVPTTGSDIGEAYEDTDPVDDPWVQFIDDPSLFSEEPGGIVVVKSMPRDFARRIAAVMIGGSASAYCSLDYSQVAMGDALALVEVDEDDEVWYRVTRTEIHPGLYVELTLEVAR